jgi:glycosyltransferase involved in cell wall biosynthesis
MKSDVFFPTISVITPTLNAASGLEAELQSIRNQNYPQDKVEIIIADGGSTDSTIEISKKYNAKIVPNKLKTGEAGKAAGLKAATGELVALIDSDNILPTENWLREMVQPFIDNSSVVGSEPWKYTYRREGGFIERYCALIGMNDPIVMFYGNYDRVNILTNKWTEIDLNTFDHGAWIEIDLVKNKKLPTIGANGTVFKSSFLNSVEVGDYLFDIDVLAMAINKSGLVKFAKVKNSIIHTFCESSINKFSRKQKRRIVDYFYYKSLNLRNVEWEDSSSYFPILKFLLYTVLIFPVCFDAVRGYLKKPDLAAWFFHPIACFITIYQYVVGVIRVKFFGANPLNRAKWKQ